MKNNKIQEEKPEIYKAVKACLNNDTLVVSKKVNSDKKFSSNEFQFYSRLVILNFVNATFSSSVIFYHFGTL